MWCFNFHIIQNAFLFFFDIYDNTIAEVRIRVFFYLWTGGEILISNVNLIDEYLHVIEHLEE